MRRISLTTWVNHLAATNQICRTPTLPQNDRYANWLNGHYRSLSGKGGVLAWDCWNVRMGRKFG